MKAQMNMMNVPIVPPVSLLWLRTEVSMTITTSRKPSSTEKDPDTLAWSLNWTMEVSALPTLRLF